MVGWAAQRQLHGTAAVVNQNHLCHPHQPAPRPQLLRATVHAAYQSEFHFHKPGELFKLADGIADALQTLPRWGAPPPGNAPNLTGYCLAITEPGAGSSEPPKTIPDQALYLQVSGRSRAVQLSLAANAHQ